MASQAESSLPAYAQSNATMDTIPSYNAANTTAPFPSNLPCSLFVKNLDRKRDPILFVDGESHDQVVFELVQLDQSRSSPFDESLYQNLVANATEIFSSPVKLVVSSDA